MVNAVQHAPKAPARLFAWDRLVLQLAERATRVYIEPRLKGLPVWNEIIGPVAAAKVEELGINRPLSAVDFARKIGLLKSKRRVKRVRSAA